jgi:hypothetical protein
MSIYLGDTAFLGDEAIRGPHPIGLFGNYTHKQVTLVHDLSFLWH